MYDLEIFIYDWVFHKWSIHSQSNLEFQLDAFLFIYLCISFCFQQRQFIGLYTMKIEILFEYKYYCKPLGGVKYIIKQGIFYVHVFPANNNVSNTTFILTTIVHIIKSNGWFQLNQTSRCHFEIHWLPILLQPLVFGIILTSND